MFTTLGLRVSSAIDFGGFDAALRSMIGWRHAFGDVNLNSVHQFPERDSFIISGATIAENAAVLEAGLDFKLPDNSVFGLPLRASSGTAHARTPPTLA